MRCAKSARGIYLVLTFVAACNTGSTCEMRGPFSVAAVGDILMTRPGSQSNDPSANEVFRHLREASVAFGNLEVNIIDIRSFQGHPFGDPGDIWTTAAPQIAADVRNMGIRMVGRANNHSTDWGAEGMRETTRWLDQAGLVHSGTGETRAGARAPRYLDLPQGRVGLVSMASTFNYFSMAMPPAGEAPGRPGMNPLRTTQWQLVTAPMMAALRNIYDSQPAGSIDPPFSVSTLPSINNSSDLSLFGVHYRVADHVGFSYTLDPVDLLENVQSIRQGSQIAHCMLATIHSHEPGNWGDEPADFLPRIAHDAIDAGADVFIGHGPHRLRGIEIYRGKPIFYSLGNFFYEDHLQQPLAEDLYEQAGAAPGTTTDAELGEKFASTYFPSDVFYHSVIAVSEFDAGRLSKITLYPIDLGYSLPPTERGTPHLAKGAVARAIIERLARLSRPFGTTVLLEGEVGVIRLPRQAF